MSELIKLEIEGQAIEHQIADDGSALYPGTEAAEALGYANPHKALADHVDPDDLTKREVIDSLGRKQSKLFITGVGLQMLTFRSNLPRAREYTRRVAAHMEAVRLRQFVAIPVQPNASAGVSRAEAMLINAKNRAYNTAIKAIDDIAASIGVSGNAISALKVKVLGKFIGEDVTALNPKREDVWIAPAAIAAEFGITQQRVGLTITKLDLRGDKPGLCEPIVETVPATGKTVPGYRYTAKAKDMIRARLIADGYLRDDGSLPEAVQ